MSDRGSRATESSRDVGALHTQFSAGRPIAASATGARRAPRNSCSSGACVARRSERKLAAIVATDVVGYSRLMGADEEGTHSRLKAHRREMIEPEIERHRGRIVKTTGDGLLLEFASVVDAVRCALEVQQGMTRRNADVPQERRIVLRIGINLGDVIVDDGDIFGDGVNIAARLEGICPPGAICLSEDAYRQVHARLDLAVSDLGPQRLKNIMEPKRVYVLEVGTGTARPRRSGGLMPQPPPRISIVVLPFKSLSTDASQDYLGDVLTEELTTSLSHLPDSFVVSCTTASAYRGKSMDVRQIGQELGVRYALEGSARKDGARVRVNARLIDTATGAHLWADQFDGPQIDLLEMQNEIVTRLARALQVELATVEATRIAGARPGNSAAEDLAQQCEACDWRYGLLPREMLVAYPLYDEAFRIAERNVRALVLLAL
jgi:adenylate cyclase